jgi:hypothetical protein
VEQRKGATNIRIAQAGKPTRSIRRQRFKVPPHNFDKHELAEAQAQAFAAGSTVSADPSASIGEDCEGWDCTMDPTASNSDARSWRSFILSLQ